MYMSVCPVVCINIYFAPNVPKVWGLQSQPLGLLWVSVSRLAAPATSPTRRHLTSALREADMWHGQQRSHLKTHVSVSGAPAAKGIGKTFASRANEDLSHFSSYISDRTRSSFQNSTLCKAPVCVSPFHSNDCNKKTTNEIVDPFDKILACSFQELSSE